MDFIIHSRQARWTFQVGTKKSQSRACTNTQSHVFQSRSIFRVHSTREPPPVSCYDEHEGGLAILFSGPARGNTLTKTNTHKNRRGFGNTEDEWKGIVQIKDKDSILGNERSMRGYILT